MFYSLVINSKRFSHTFSMQSHKSTLAVTTLSRTCGITRLYMSIFTSLLQILIASLDDIMFYLRKKIHYIVFTALSGSTRSYYNNYKIYSLGETLLRLETTFAELRHVLQVLEEESDLIGGLETRGALPPTCYGNTEMLSQQMDHFQVIG